MSADPSDFAVGDRVRILSGVHAGVEATVTRIGVGSVGIVRDGETSPTSYFPGDLRTVPGRHPHAPSTAHLLPVGTRVLCGYSDEPATHRTGTVHKLDPRCPDNLVYYVRMDDTRDDEWWGDDDPSFVKALAPSHRRLVIHVTIPDDETPAEYLETTSSVTALIDYIAEHHDTVLVNVEETTDAR